MTVRSEKKFDLDNTGLYNSIMAGTKEISRDLRKRVVGAYQAGKGYKRVSNQFGLHQLGRLCAT